MKLFPPEERRGEVHFHVAPALPYRARVGLAGLLIAAGFVLQMLLLERAFWLGLPVVFAGVLLLLSKGYQNKAEHARPDRDWRPVEEYEVEHGRERTGFKGVTHLALHPSQRFIAYTTETSKRLMRYDLLERRQLPDLATLDGDDLYDRRWFIALAYAADGRLLVTRGDHVEVYAEDGRVADTISLQRFGYGFAQITVCADQRHALAANIFTGIACKFEIATGKVLAHVQTDHVSPRRSLAGIAEFPG